MCIAALLRVLSVVLVVYRDLALEVRCWSYQSFMLPTLGGYMREVALSALCCSCLLIAAPAWIIYFTFVILRSVCLLLYFCSLTLFWFLFFYFIFIRYLAGWGLHGGSRFCLRDRICFLQYPMGSPSSRDGLTCHSPLGGRPLSKVPEGSLRGPSSPSSR